MYIRLVTNEQHTDSTHVSPSKMVVTRTKTRQNDQHLQTLKENIAISSRGRTYKHFKRQLTIETV